VAVDIPIETPQRNRGVVTEAPAPAPRSVPAPVEPTSEPVPEPAPTAAPASVPALAPPTATAAPSASAPVTAAASAPAPVGPASAPRPESGARARALLEGGAASAPAAARFVVQVGAYSDANALREVRAKVEKVGLKTYTQVVETSAGPRTRVRIGPFATRDEAEKAAARLKGGGLPAAILAL
jgi:DedD protein